MTAFGSINSLTQIFPGPGPSGGGLMVVEYKPMSTTIKTGWSTRANQTNATQNGSVVQGGSLRTSTAATTNSQAGLRMATNMFGTDKDPSAEIALMPNNNISVEYYAGLSSGNGVYTSAGLFIAFRAIGAGNWFGACANGTTLTTTDLGEAPSLSVPKVLKIVVSGTGTRADFYINNVNKGNITSNLPSTSTTMTPVVDVVTTSDAVRSVDIVYVAMWQSL